MVPASSVGASATLPPAPPSVPASQLPAAPPIDITPLPPQDVTPVPPASGPVPASNAAFPNQK
jgi:general secretion pathway protein D